MMTSSRLRSRARDEWLDRRLRLAAEALHEPPTGDEELDALIGQVRREPDALARRARKKAIAKTHQPIQDEHDADGGAT
jgi:hypothetical protein